MTDTGDARRVEWCVRWERPWAASERGAPCAFVLARNEEEARRSGWRMLRGLGVAAGQAVPDARDVPEGVEAFPRSEIAERGDRADWTAFVARDVPAGGVH